MHGMHAVMGFLRSRPLGPNSPECDRNPIKTMMRAPSCTVIVFFEERLPARPLLFFLVHLCFPSLCVFVKSLKKGHD